jgi:hypothetical protein
MTYHAERRLQITLLDGSRPAKETHEDRGGRTALCNIALRPLEGQQAKFSEVGPGEVTCGRCARSHGRTRRRGVATKWPRLTVTRRDEPAGSAPAPMTRDRAP